MIILIIRHNLLLIGAVVTIWSLFQGRNPNVVTTLDRFFEFIEFTDSNLENFSY